jgi:hypothetical protein
MMTKDPICETARLGLEAALRWAWIDIVEHIRGGVPTSGAWSKHYTDDLELIRQACKELNVQIPGGSDE